MSADAVATFAQCLVRLQRASQRAIENTRGWPEMQKAHFAHTHQLKAYGDAVALLRKHCPDVVQAAIEALDADIERRAAVYVNEDGTPQGVQWAPEYEPAADLCAVQHIDQHVPTAVVPQGEPVGPLVEANDYSLHDSAPAVATRADGTAAVGGGAAVSAPNSDRHDAVPGQARQPGAVGLPVGGAGGGDRPVVVQVYAPGIGVTLVREGHNLPLREGAFELEARGVRVVVDPLAAKHAERLVLAVERDVAAVSEPLQAVDQEDGANFGGVGCGHGTSLVRTAILSMPQGSGKTRIAEQLAPLIGCGGVIEEWWPGQLLRRGALHLTHAPADEVLL